MMKLNSMATACAMSVLGVLSGTAILGLAGSAHAAPAVAAASASKASAAAPINVTAIAFSTEGASTTVRLTTSGGLSALAPPFMMNNPSRLVFDMPAGLNMTGKRSHESAQGDISRLDLIQAEGILRVVANLRDATSHKFAIEGNDVVLTVSTQGVTGAIDPRAGSVAQAVRKFAEGDESKSHSLSAMDFRRGPAGEGRVIVDLTDANTGIEIRQQGTQIFVDFQSASIAEKLLRKLNVADFGTPIKVVNVSRNGSGVRMVVEPTGMWEYNAYQTDSRFVLEVRPVVYDPNKLVQGTGGGYKGDRMTLNFQNVDVRALLNVIADFTKLNIVAADSVQGTMTVRLQDVPWDQAMDIIMQTRGLDMRKNGNVILVAPRDEIAKREKDQFESANQINDLEPLRTESFLLNYSRASEVAVLLSNDKQRILSKRGSVVTDTRTNQVFVQDSPSKLEEVRRIIAKVDIAVRQVQIEARIVEATDKFSRTLGARLGFVSTQPWNLLGGGTRGILNGGTVTNASVTNQLANTVAPDLLTQGTSVNLPAPNLSSGAQAASLGMTLLNAAGTRFLNLELQALEADGRGKIVSSPSVVTADQEQALIEQGTELPYLEASSSGAATISFKKANLKLEVTPQITPDGNVIMQVEINKDAPGISTAAGLSIDNKHIKTKVLVDNGGTVVIGGIFTQEQRTDINKVPFLGDLPVVGNLFKNTIKRDDKTELLVFLTPRIIDGRAGGEAAK